MTAKSWFGVCVAFVFANVIFALKLLGVDSQGVSLPEQPASERLPLSYKVPTYAHLYDLEVSYLAEVKPIFQRVCFDCHGDQRSDAWYKDVYGLRHWLSSKQQAGRKKLILDQGLPFGSDLDNLEIVRKLKQQLDDGTMPPLSYRLANWYDMLGYDEMKVVKHWLHRAERVMEGKEVDPTDFGEREASTGELKGNGEHRGREGS